MTQKCWAPFGPICLDCPLQLAIAQPDGVAGSFPFPTLIATAILTAAHGGCQGSNHSCEVVFRPLFGESVTQTNPISVQ